MPHSRRTVLRIGIVLGGHGFSGCLEGPASTTTESDDDEMPTEVKLWIEESYITGGKGESVDPLVFSELPEDQREILQTAIEEGEYTTQMGEESRAFINLKNNIDARANEEGKVYLKQGDDYYRVGLVEGDHIIAET